MATVEDAAAAALGLPGVSETIRYGHRTWSVSGRVFAWERPFSKADLKRFGTDPVPAGPILALAVADLSEKEALLAEQSHYFTIPHFNGYPAVLLALAGRPAELVRGAVLDAWLACAPEDLAREHLAQD